MTKTYEVPFSPNENDKNLNKNGIKRMSKPQMEKRRRARINNSLEELKKMVVDSKKLNIQNSKSKLEKADILEYTVRYVKELHQNLFLDRKENSGANQSPLFDDFVAGFSECAKRVEEFVCQSPPIDPIVVTSLSTHLKKCIQTLETHDSLNYGVIRHTGQCCPPSPAPSTISSTSGSVPNPMLDMDMSSIGSADEDLPLNLSNNRFADHFHHQMMPGEDGVWRPW